MKIGWKLTRKNKFLNKTTTTKVIHRGHDGKQRQSSS